MFYDMDEEISIQGICKSSFLLERKVSMKQNRKSALKKKLYFSLLAAGLLGSMIAFPAQAKDYAGKIPPGENITDKTMNFQIDHEPPSISIYDSTITLTGPDEEDNKELITVNEQPNPNLIIDLVGKNTLKLGSDNNAVYQITGTLHFADNNTIAVDKGIVKMITWNGDGSSDTTLTGRAEIDSLNGSLGTTFRFGDAEKAAHVAITTSALDGGIMFLDPIWSGTGEDLQEHGSEVAIESTLVDGKYIVGQNSTLSFGTTSFTEAQEAFKKSGLTWGRDNIGSALYIHESTIISDPNSFIYLDPELTTATFNRNGPPPPSGGSVTLKEGSILMVDGSKFDIDKDSSAPFAIRDARSTDTEHGKLFVLDAQKNHTYRILDGQGLAGTKFDKIFTNNTLLKLKRVDDTTTETEFKVKASLNDQSPLLTDSPLGNVIRNGLEEEGPVADLINAIANDQINPTEEDRKNAVSSLANFGEVAGATHGTYTAARTFMDLSQDHLSIAKHETELHKDLWADYVHNRESVSGLSLANMKADYEGSYNTFIVGSDLYAKDNLVLGVATTYGTGKISSRNSRVVTKNDATYYGASIYGRKINGKTAYLADISYLRGENDITQRNSGQVITGKPKTNAYSFGIKAEQQLETGYGTLIPYAGFRYMHLSQGKYTTSHQFTYDQEDQNLFLIPLGVKLTSERKMGNWNVKPMAEVGVIINAGDKDTKQTVSVGSGQSTMDYTIVNGTSLLGKLGVQAEKENVTIGVSYQYQKSSDTSDNRFNINVGYRF